jgi:hypothetical protein
MLNCRSRHPMNVLLRSVFEYQKTQTIPPHLPNLQKREDDPNQKKIPFVQHCGLLRLRNRQQAAAIRAIDLAVGAHVAYRIRATH